VHRTPLLLIAAALLAAIGADAAGETLRVGTSGDYPPFSVRVGSEPAAIDGLDVALARSYAEARGLELVLVPFRWPKLIKGLKLKRFDVAMSGVTITPQRSAIARFSVPVVQTGAVVLARQPARFPDLDALNRSIIRIGVNAGGYLQGVASAHFPRATQIAIPENSAVLDALLAENVHAVVTDNVEAAVWLTAAPGLIQLGPLTRDRKAFLVRADRTELASDLDAWLLEREAAGDLAALRRRFLGENAGPRTAEPLVALLAAVDERLALMATVGVAKRRQGLPLLDTRREAVVLRSAVENVNAAAAVAGRPPPSEESVRAVFRAQIEAAKQLQKTALKDPDFQPPEPLPSVEDVLRPALIRLGEKIAGLLVRLPENLDRESLRAAARAELRTPQLGEASVFTIADALAAMSRTDPPQ